ncbi:hypothetical protein [Prevotella sp. S7-1-8]|uniref:hypothetical protein n=1 Tax=Prevotella sp. S7-1-8 TaxID=1284775 RepID=UPI0012E0B202|nr:hypothetical protein [Prevotella sp. S7-1-8]
MDRSLSLWLSIRLMTRGLWSFATNGTFSINTLLVSSPNARGMLCLKWGVMEHGSKTGRSYEKKKLRAV